MACSRTEVRAVQDGVAHDVRHDGRTLLQRRPVRVRVDAGASEVLHTSSSGKDNNNKDVTAATSAAAAAGDAYDNYNGSSVTVSIDDTTVLATATPSVIEVGDGSHNASEQQHDNNNNDNNSGGGGVLYIAIDAAGGVLDAYAHALGGRNTRYRHVYLSYLTQAIHDMFGAQRVVMTSEGDGVAEAQRVSDEEKEDEDDDDEESNNNHSSTHNATHAVSSSSSSTAAAAGANGIFPARDLYIGNGFAFRIDVDVHVLQAGGGSVLACIAHAVHVALKTLRLPAVTLHEAAAGVSVEVHRTQPYTRRIDWSSLPLLCTLLLCPTRHGMVDPTLREELALPQQLHVAANAHGQVCYVHYTQLPSRYGNVLQHTGSGNSSSSGGGGAVVAATRTSNSNGDDGDGVATHKHVSSSSSHGVVVTDYASLHPGDWLSLVQDAVHVCQAMIVECDDALVASAQS